MYILFLIIAFILNGTANVLLKAGAQKGIVFNGFSLSIITSNYLFIIGLFCFALNALFYFLALRSMPISVAYPIMVGASFLIINSFALLQFGEKISPLQIVGYGFLIIGIIMILSFSVAK